MTGAGCQRQGEKWGQTVLSTRRNGDRMFSRGMVGPWGRILTHREGKKWRKCSQSQKFLQLLQAFVTLSQWSDVE
jgi:hypothetical protein